MTSQSSAHSDMWEIDRMLLGKVISLDEHATLEQFIHDIHEVRLFNIAPQTFEVKSHTNIPSSGTLREAIAWKKLSKIRELFKQDSLELDTMMMDLGLDEAKDYPAPMVKRGIQILSNFYSEW